MRLTNPPGMSARFFEDRDPTAHRRLVRTQARVEYIAGTGSFRAPEPFDPGGLVLSPQLERLLGRRCAPGSVSLLTLLRDIVHPDDRADVVASLRRAAYTGEGVDFECRLQRPDRSIRWVRGRVEPEDDREAAPRFWIGFAQDVTAQVCLEEELRHARAVEAMGTLATGIAHHYNNVIMGASACLELAVRSQGQDGPGLRYLGEARDALARGARLARRLVDLAQTDETDPVPLELDPGVERCSEMLRAALGRGIELDLDLSARNSWVRLGPRRLETLLLSVAHNARDAMPGGGSLGVCTRRVTLWGEQARRLGLAEGAYVCLQVRDTGNGMDETTARRAFEPFLTTKTEGPAIGLGLTTVYWIVHHGHGHVGVQTSSGRGTTVVIHLPGVRAEPVPVAAEVCPQRETVLVVTDDPVIGSAVRASLEPLNYRVLESFDVDEAWSWRQRPEIDIGAVIVGFDVAEPAAWVLAWKCPIVFLCVAGPESPQVRKRRPRGTRRVQVPFTARELASAVRQGVSGTRGGRRRS